MAAHVPQRTQVRELNSTIINLEIYNVRLMKAIFVAAALMLSSTAFALTDDEQVELAWAMDNGDVAVVQKLIKSGALDVNQPAFGWSWLHVAATKNQLAIAKLLVENGADLSVRHPMTKATPLAQAALSGSTEVVKYLLSKGADPNIKLRANVSVLRAVREQGTPEIATILEQNGAKDDGCQEEKCF